MARVRLSYRLALFSGVTVVLLGACLWIALVNRPILEALDEYGLSAQGEITWISAPYRSHRATPGGRIQDVQYRYQTADGAWFTDEISRSREASRHLSVGHRFEVTYLPDRPHLHDSTLGGQYAGMAMVGWLLAAAAVTAALAGREWRRAR